jgi:hypothetical protein
MARVLIVAGGCRGRRLAGWLRETGHAVRATTRTEAGRRAIEAVGAECWIGTPDRIGSLRYALENVTILCWLLGTAAGADSDDLHGSRLEFMLSQTIDTTVRGVVYEAAGPLGRELFDGGSAIVRRMAERNEIPYRVIAADPAHAEQWDLAARDALAGLMLQSSP